MLSEQTKNKISRLTAPQFNFLWRQVEKLEKTLTYISTKPEYNKLNLRASLRKIHIIEKFAQQYNIPAITALSNSIELPLKNSLLFSGNGSIDLKPELEYFVLALKTIAPQHYNKQAPLNGDDAQVQTEIDENSKSVIKVSSPDIEITSAKISTKSKDEHFSRQQHQKARIESGTVGIDIGHHSIKIVVLEQIKEKLSLVYWTIHEFKNQSRRPDFDEIADILSGFFKKYNIYKKLPIVTALIDNNYMVRYKELPHMSDRNFIRTTELEIHSELFFEDRTSRIFTYSYPKITTKKPGNKCGIVLAIDENIIKQTIGFLKKSRIKIKQLSIDILSLAQFTNQDQNYTTAIVDIGSDKIKILIIENNAIRFARTIDSYENKLTNDISQLEQISFWKAEKIKRNLDFLLKSRGKGKNELQELRGESGTPQNIVFQNLHKVANEIHLSLQFYNSKSDSAIEKIYLSGGGSQLPGIRDFLAIDLELSVVPLNVIQDIEVSEHILPADEQSRIAPLLATAVGLCKSYHQPAMDLRIDLRKKVTAHDDKKSRKLIAGIVLSVVICLLLLGIRYALIHRSNKLQISIDQKQNLNNELKTKISDLDHFNVLKDDIDSQIHKIKSLKIRQPLWSLVLREVSKTIPRDIWLTQFSGTYQSAEMNSEEEELDDPLNSEDELTKKIQYSHVLFLGQTSNPDQIQEFIYNMERNTNFHYINFNKITSRKTEKADITSFQIDGRIQISGN